MGKNPQFNIGQRILLETLWIICRGFAMLPHFVRHQLFGGLLFVILCYVLRYRKRVVMQNLRSAFPEKSEAKLRQICIDSYRNLAEQIVTTLSQSGVSEEKMLQRMKVVNVEQTRQSLKDRNAIFMTAHYGSWEACVVMGIIFDRYEFVCVYHELKNKVMDEIMKRLRKCRNSALVDIKATMRYFLHNKDQKPLLMGLISDQSPKYRPNLHWHKFLHHWTAFYNGAEVMALKYNLPVYYYSLSRVKSGHYQGEFIQIYDGEEEVEPNVIMERYVRLLEKDIIKAPHMWLWSHRRWKHRPPQELLSQKI